MKFEVFLGQIKLIFWSLKYKNDNFNAKKIILGSKLAIGNQNDRSFMYSMSNGHFGGFSKNGHFYLTTVILVENNGHFENCSESHFFEYKLYNS